MKTLVQINTTANYTSTGRIAENIGLLARQNGWRSILVHGPRYVNPSQLSTFCTETSLGEKIHAVKSFLMDEHGLGSSVATRQLVKKLKELRPDIIHLHNIHGYYINYPILFNYLSEANTPVVWTLHDCWSMTGHCAYFDFVNCDKWKTHCKDCPQLGAYPKSLFKDNSYNNFELKRKYFLKAQQCLHIVTVSDWLRDIVKESFFRDCDIQRVYNGVDLSKFYNHDNAYKNNGVFKIIGVANIWEKRKGLYDFVKLRQCLPVDKYEIVLVGISPQISKRLPEGIKVIRRTNSIDELSELYSSADVFFNPTWEDNFPTTNIEALACGTPVITYRTGGSPEAVSKETGFIVNKGDLQAVVEALNVVRERGRLYFRDNCRERAVTNFDMNFAYGQYMKIYEELYLKDK